MAQETQQNQVHGSINFQNPQLQVSEPVGNLGVSYNPTEEDNITQRYNCSPVKSNANGVNTCTLSANVDPKLVSVCSGTVLSVNSLGLSRGGAHGQSFAAGQMTHPHAAATATQPDMLETLLSRNPHVQVPVLQTYPQRTNPSTGVTQFFKQNQPVNSVSSSTGVRHVVAPRQSAEASYATSSAPSGVATDPEKRRLIQQQLILLLHAHRCQRQENEGSGRASQCPTPHCMLMRNVLQHMASCNEGKNCQEPHCASSRQIISHWKNCSSRECPVCEPLKQNQRTQSARQQQNQAPGQQNSNLNPDLNGSEGSPHSTVSQNHLPSQISRSSSVIGNSLTVCSGARPSPFTIAPLPDSTTVNGVSCTPIDQTGWRKDVNMPQRNHVIRRIVRFIFPSPDPAAYSDPRMRNLIEYARKVEREMYTTATDMEHYFHLLAQKCYKIHRELDEKRKSRQLVADTSISTTLTTSTTISPAASRPNQQLSVLSSPSFTSSSSVYSGKPSCAINGNSSLNNFDLGSFTSQDSSGCEGNMSKFEDYLHRYKSEANANAHSGPLSNASSSTSVASVAATVASINKVGPEENEKPSILTQGSAISVKQEESSSSETAASNDSFSEPPSLTSVSSIKPDESKWKRWSREELLRHFLPLHEEVYNDRYAEPFRAPVDPVVLHIPDYFHVIKEPMDLTTIRNNLEDGKYTDPWHVVDHFRLMFNNAWLYNKKTSKVYKMCTKLAELFQSRIDQVMQAMGFCCGQDCEYQPQGIYCASANLCTIARDATYYVYFNNDKQATGLVCDKYYQCERCFMDAGEFIVLSDEANQSTSISKEQFEKRKNNVKEKEEFVTCNDCGRRWHKVCALHMNEIWSAGFVCPGCLKEKGLKRSENKFSAKKLPVTRLSAFLEKRVNDFLKKKEVNTSEVTIRVLASSDKTVEVKPLMRARFTDSGELSESFPYRLKAIFAFQEIDGQDVCFFGLYVQEYGSNSPQPNRRRVYVAYLDSVFFFRPKQYRTDVYHEILVGYLHYAKRCGYTMAHIWACPPGEGDDYIFHMHPAEQKIPKAKRLQEWYRRMLQKSIIEGIVVDYKNILNDALDHQLVSPTEIPYFEGDFWPNTLEDILKELEEEEARRKREEAMAQAEAEGDESDIDCLCGDGLSGDSDKRSAKKKAKKRKGNKKGNTSMTSKRKRLDGPMDGAEELSRKVYDTMEKLKEIFFVIRLHRHNSAASLPPVTDPDQPIHSELMDSRDAFLQTARERHLEFSSLRRAKYSTMVLLYELHNEQRQSFMYNCNVCGAQIETRWHCNECEEYDLCSRCYKTENHPHPMVKYGLGIDDGGGEDAGDRAAGSGASNDRRRSIDRCIKSLMHACQCRDANCRMHSCTQMKRVLYHARTCTKKQSNTCLLCRQLLSLLWHHARCCEVQQCPVPFCANIKYRMRQKSLQQRLQNNKLLRRRISTMNRGAFPGNEHNAAVPNATNASLPASDLSHPTQNHSSLIPSVPSSNAVAHMVPVPHAGAPCGFSGGPTATVPSSASSFVATVDSHPHQQTRTSETTVFVPHAAQVSVARPVTCGTSSLPTGTRVVVQRSQFTGGGHGQLPPTAASPGMWRARPPLNAIASVAQLNSTSGPSLLPAQAQNQLISTASSSLPGVSTDQPNDKGISIAALGARAKPQDISRVTQVISVIRATGLSYGEQNRRFIQWIQKHPEYHAAFFALHSQRRQPDPRSQSTQSRLVGGNSIPTTSGSSTAVISTLSDVTQPLIVSDSLPTGVVVVPSSVPANISNHSSFVSGGHIQNLPCSGSSVSTLPIVNSTVPLMTAPTLQMAPTLRFRTAPASAAIVQSQSQQLQHFYNTTSASSLAAINAPLANSGSPAGMFVSTTNAGMVPVGGTTQLIGATPQRIASVSGATLSSLSRQSTTAQTALVHLRSQQAVSSVQPHIFLANTTATAIGQIQHQTQPQIVSASTGGRQVVALMTQQSLNHPSVTDTNGPLDPNTTSGAGSGVK